MKSLQNVLAPAKLNLFLHITGRRTDGYHLLQSVFMLIDWYDTLHFEVRPNGQISREDLSVPLPTDDLITRAARLLQQSSGTSMGAHIAIDKSIPAQAGMGGGSSKVVFAIDGLGLGDQVALITDGHLSGLVCKGLVVAEVSPEGVVCGPLALVKDGDTITIDLETQRCDLEVDEAEMAKRREAWTPSQPQFDSGWLQIYRRNVGPLTEGAVLVNPR